VQILRYFYIFLFSFILSLTSCQNPVKPDIFGVHISCHFNPGYEDHMWIFQVWVDHPVQLQDIREVEVYLYNAYGEKSYFSLRPDGKYLWNSIVLEQNTNLGCGRWYDIDIVATDYYGYTDFLETYYQK
jgi:hypothetical protein